MKRPPIKTLSGDTVDAKPRTMDWSEGYGEKWECYEASRCDKCGAVIVGTNGENHCDLDSGSDCDGHVPQNEGPMMNYFYPLPCLRGAPFADSLPEAAKAIAHLPLCVIDIDGEQGLALTGGGMDLSWEICEAHMCLGYLPPVHFRLPAMCGRGTSTTDKWIMAGYRRSAQVLGQWAKNAYRSVQDLKVHSSRKTVNA